MKRIDINYGGERYSVGERDLDQVKKEIETGLALGPRWLEVNEGDGMPRTAFLLITPGVPMSLIPIPEEPPADDE